MFQFSYYHVLLVFWTITLSLVDHSATGQRTCLRSDKVPEAKSMPTTTRFTDIGPAVFAPADVQCKVRTSPNCLFPQWDKKLKQWDEGCFCMEETLTGGGCIGDYNNDGFDDMVDSRLVQKFMSKLTRILTVLSSCKKSAAQLHF